MLIKIFLLVLWGFTFGLANNLKNEFGSKILFQYYPHQSSFYKDSTQITIYVAKELARKGSPKDTLYHFSIEGEECKAVFSYQKDSIGRDGYESVSLLYRYINPCLKKDGFLSTHNLDMSKIIKYRSKSYNLKSYEFKRNKEEINFDKGFQAISKVKMYRDSLARYFCSHREFLTFTKYTAGLDTLYSYVEDCTDWAGEVVGSYNYTLYSVVDRKINVLYKSKNYNGISEIYDMDGNQNYMFLGGIEGGACMSNCMMESGIPEGKMLCYSYTCEGDPNDYLTERVQKKILQIND